MRNKYISVTEAISLYADYRRKAVIAMFDLRGNNYGEKGYNCWTFPEGTLQTTSFVQHLIARFDNEGEPIFRKPLTLFGKRKGETELISLIDLQSDIVDNQFNQLMGNHKLGQLKDKSLAWASELYRSDGYILVNNYDYSDRYNPSTNYDCLMDMDTKQIKYTNISIEHKEFWEFMKTTFDGV